MGNIIIKGLIVRVLKSWITLDSEFDWYWWGYEAMQSEILDQCNLSYSLKELKAAMKELKNENIVKQSYLVDYDHRINGSGYCLVDY